MTPAVNEGANELSVSPDVTGSPSPQPQQPEAVERRAHEREIRRKIEHLREWGHLVSIGIMVLAMFAFGVHVEGDPPHVKVHWKEVPAILIVFVLAEFGVVLVSAAMEVRVSVQSAGEATQEAAKNARTAASDLKDLGRVGDTAKEALEDLNDSLLQLAAASEGNIWNATGDLVSYCGISHKDCWESLAGFTRSWVPEQFTKDCGAPVGLLFQSFSSKSGGVRSGKSEISCVTTDAAFADASREWLAEILAKNTQGLIVYAVTTLLPTDFALPHLWWSRNGKPYRVQTLDTFTAEVLRLCRRDDVEYRRVTVFNSRDSKFPEARVLDGEPEEYDRVVQSKDLSRSLDEWFIVDDRLAPPEVRQFSNMFKSSLQRAGLKGDLAYAELSWNRILDDLKIENTPERNKLTRRNRQSHTLPEVSEAGEVDYARFDFEDGKRQLLFFSQRALEARLDFNLDGIDRMAASRKERLAKVKEKGGSLLQVLQAFDYLSLRDWYIRKMHRSVEKTASCYWVANDREKLKALSIEWDREEIPTLDLLLIGTRDKSWLGAAIANIQLDSPSCLVKIVTGEDELEKISQTAESLFLESKDWKQFHVGSPIENEGGDAGGKPPTDQDERMSEDFGRNEPWGEE